MRPQAVPVVFRLINVIKCHKTELRQTVEDVMAHIIPYEDYVQKGWNTFNNADNSCREIIDAIEYFTQGSPDTSTPDFLSKQVTSSKYSPCTMWNHDHP